MEPEHDTPHAPPTVALPVMVAAELQDALLTAMHDLHRLQGLLNHATDNLIARFGEADGALPDALVDADPALAMLRLALRDAVTELQFHDMATQLVTHTGKVLQACAMQLGEQVLGLDEGEQGADLDDLAPNRPNPVTQSEMQAGSIELF
ncbi:hypothetical protein GCM10022279_02260 [Comamonas faecalis]|uniref:Chemotaxis protein CheZ n=1 Tax=Comamonas faecalis TaxID=1387849 RepID=A0ABP7QGL0_9BURK